MRTAALYNSLTQNSMLGADSASVGLNSDYDDYQCSGTYSGTLNMKMIENAVTTLRNQSSVNTKVNEPKGAT